MLHDLLPEHDVPASLVIDRGAHSSVSLPKARGAFRAPALADFEQGGTSGELQAQAAAACQLLIEEAESLNRLYSVVRQAGCDVLFYLNGDRSAGHDGARRRPDWRDYAVSSEALSVSEVLGVACEHLHGIDVRMLPARAQSSDLTSLASPVFDAEGGLIGLLDIAAPDGVLPDGSLPLIRAFVEITARAIEERSFRKTYCRNWIVALTRGNAKRGVLFALDRDQRLVGADRHAHAMLLERNINLASGSTLWSLFQKNTEPFRGVGCGDVPAAFVSIAASEAWSALVTPPRRETSHRRGHEVEGTHCRPRLDAIGQLRRPSPPPKARGGLAPRTLHRVREYIDAHLAEGIDLEALAAAAGLSKCHFARAFKQSVGTPPHSYLMQRRLERAEKLLVETDLSLAGIALDTGFTDQSHFSRCFRQYFGTNPRSFRWSGQ